MKTYGCKWYNPESKKIEVIWFDDEAQRDEFYWTHWHCVCIEK